MSLKLLREFVLLSLSESPLARVPTQLMDPDEVEEEGGKKTGGCECGSTDESCGCSREIDEFSGAGAVAGFAAPLGMGTGTVSRKNRKRGKK